MSDRVPSPADASSLVHDVIVIGAGPAGGLAALLLAQEGLRVLLVDRRPFPRYKVCGACLNARALAILRTADLEDEVRSLPGVPLTRVSFSSGGRRLQLPLTEGLAVARDRLDAVIVEAGVRAGVEFVPETTATVLPGSHGLFSRSVQLASHGQHPREVAARVVLAADGLGQSSLQQLPEFSNQIAPGSRIGLGTTVTEFPECYESGAIYLAVGREGYVGLVRTADGELNVAAAVDGAFVKRIGGPPQAAASLLESARCPAVPSLAGADWHGTPPLTRTPSRVAGHRLLLLGDSTGYVEPFTGEGMAWALGAAELIVPLARLAVERWDPLVGEAWTNLCRQKIGSRQRWCRILAGLVRRPWAAHPVMTILSWFPALARPLVREISGPSHLVTSSAT